MTNLKQKIEEIQDEIDALEVPWIVINYKEQPALFECGHCRVVSPVPFNCRLEYVLNVSRAFKMTHAFCEKEEEE